MQRKHLWFNAHLVTILETLVTTTLESLNSFSIVFMKKLLVKSAKDELASSDSALSQVYCNFVITEAEGSFINHVDKSIQDQNKHQTSCIFDRNLNKYQCGPSKSGLWKTYFFHKYNPLLRKYTSKVNDYSGLSNSCTASFIIKSDFFP